MIKEIDRLDHTSLYLLKTTKLDDKSFNELHIKIQKLQRQPFARIYLFVFPPIFPQLIKKLKEKDLKAKSIISDNKVFRLEF